MTKGALNSLNGRLFRLQSTLNGQRILDKHFKELDERKPLAKELWAASTYSGENLSISFRSAEWPEDWR